MPGPTNAELIRELMKEVSILKEQVQTLRGETAPLREITTKLFLLEHQVGELKKAKETFATRTWMILTALIAGAAGSLLTFYLKR